MISIYRWAADRECVVQELSHFRPTRRAWCRRPQRRSAPPRGPRSIYSVAAPIIGGRRSPRQRSMTGGCQSEAPRLPIRPIISPRHVGSFECLVLMAARPLSSLLSRRGARDSRSRDDWPRARRRRRSSTSSCRAVFIARAPRPARRLCLPDSGVELERTRQQCAAAVPSLFDSARRDARHDSRACLSLF